MGAIFKREFKAYFINMSGYIFISILLVFAGIFTMAINLLQQYAAFEFVLSNISIVLLLLIPILTMRSVAEERRARTDQLLYALPMCLSSIVIGKYLAMVSVFALACFGMGLIPVILSMFGTVYFASVYAALLGFFLLGCSLIAICMFLSSVTESQIIAAVISFGAVLALYLMSGLASLLPVTALGSFIAFAVVAAVFAVIVYLMTKNYIISLGVAAVCIVPLSVAYLINGDAFAGVFPKVIEYLAVFDRFDNFIYGIFDITAIVYYLSVTVFFVFLTVQSLEKRRWS